MWIQAVAIILPRVQQHYSGEFGEYIYIAPLACALLVSERPAVHIEDGIRNLIQLSNLLQT
jgi:hypothetical protein